MSLRFSWEGFLRLNLITVPVKAFNVAISGKGKIGFHMIHAKCGNRIRYQKTCPVHGEVPNEEIVQGYEHAKGEYTLLDKKQLAQLRPDADKSISLDAFVAPEAIDPIYFGERAYYLTPDGRVAQKSYGVLQRAMAEKGRYAVGTMVFSGREQLVLVRPLGRLLAVHLLQYEEQVKKPAAFEEEVGEVEVAAKELELAESLVEASTPKDFNLGAYHDEQTGKLQAMIESKAGARKKGSPSKGEEPAIINLMDALRKSLEEAGHSGKQGSRRRGGAGKAHGPRRKKTG